MSSIDSAASALDQWLAQYHEGTLSFEAFCTLVRQQQAQDAEQVTRWAQDVRTRIAAGRVPQAIGRDLDALTAVTAAHIVPQHEATLLRSPQANVTLERTRPMAERRVDPLDAVYEVQAEPLQPGSVIKQRFVLEKMIGKGGMGLVFAALDRRKQEARDPNPYVALKVLNANFQRHPQAFIALQREARKAQTLAHPNVVTVFDFDREGDTVYMTMELLQGRSLDAIVREARGTGVGHGMARSIIHGIAKGLAYAHRKGIVHSDLKPGNVFILDDGTVKILDFGIARAVPNTAAGQVPDVFDAGSLGAYTEAYATVEMVDGADPHPADDIYALGLIGYELLTGFHPYQRYSLPQARELNLQAPSLKGAGLKRHEVRALERCLAFERRERPQNAAEFLEAFRSVSRLQKATLVAAALLAIVAGYVSFQNYRQAGPSVPFAQLPSTTQQRFSQLMRQGDEEWRFYERERNPAALESALDRYAEAYKLHERNRAATRALDKVADAWLAALRDHPDLRREAARSLLERSEHFRRYEPVIEAAR